MADLALDVAIDFGPDRAAIDRALGSFCDHRLVGLTSPVADAIRYSLTGEGKRLRGILFLRAYEAAGGARDASALAAAIEVVHAYSLVHDDLPCMDDDDVRRGRPTVHRAYGVAAATAAGLAMVPLAALCAGGQLLDLEGEGRPLALEDLQRIHGAKTGALIAAAATIGGRAAGASSGALTALARYGDAIGLAFQIADDVLDVTSTTSQLGKTAGRDLALRKSTYPALLGIDGARARASALVEQGCSALDEVGLLTPALSRIAHFTVERTS